MSTPTVRFIKAREELRNWLADLQLLEKRVDVLENGYGKFKAFNDAWTAAMEQACKAATEYAEAVAEMIADETQ